MVCPKTPSVKRATRTQSQLPDQRPGTLCQSCGRNKTALDRAANAHATAQGERQGQHAHFSGKISKKGPNTSCFRMSDWKRGTGRGSGGREHVRGGQHRGCCNAACRACLLPVTPACPSALPAPPTRVDGCHAVDVRGGNDCQVCHAYCRRRWAGVSVSLSASAACWVDRAGQGAGGGARHFGVLPLQPGNHSTSPPSSQA